MVHWAVEQSFGKEPAARKPNIIFILADDLGYADLNSFGGHGHNTPELDRLVREGLKVPQAYAASSVCSPSRIGLITGRYPGRLRVGLEEPIARANHEIGLPPSIPTLPSLLRGAGYDTVLIGKWHMGSLPDYGPLKSGYNRFYGIYEGGGDYFRNDGTVLGEEYGQLYDGEKPIDRIGYLTNQLGDHAVQEIRRAAAGKAPLFMSLHFTAPHWPWEGPEDESVARKLGNLLHLDGGSPAIYAAMVRAMDANVGRVMAELRRQGMERDTIVIFSSDNGGERYSDSWPLTGMKGELLEGGIRVPLVLRWPGHFAAGSTTGQVMVLMDFFPTLLAVAGTAPNPAYPPDGQNLLDVFLGKREPFERAIYWRHKKHDQAAVRKGDWKYLRINGREHLFDVAEDPRERAEKKDVFPDMFKRLREDFEKWNAEMLPYTENSFSSDVYGAADRY